MTSSEGRSAIGAAGAWLRDYLERHDGQAGAGAILLAGVAAGHAPRTTRRAASGIGVVMSRKGRGTVWTLPREQVDTVPGQMPGHEPGQVRGQAVPDKPTPPTEPEPVTPPRTWRVPGRSDIYGHASAFTQVSTAEAGSHWDERQWHSIDELYR